MPTTPTKNMRLPWVKTSKPFENVKLDSFYNSALWRRFRLGYLAFNPLCRECESMGVTTPATTVHHLKSILDGGEKWDYLNLEGLCSSCHNKRGVNKRWGKDTPPGKNPHTPPS